MLVLGSHAGLVFEILCLMNVEYLSNTIYQMQQKKIICTYENRINFITKWGQPMESTKIGKKAKVYESMWSGGNESRSSGFYFPIYTAAFQNFTASDFCHNYLHTLHFFACLL